jgi:hypothetical protein
LEQASPKFIIKTLSKFEKFLPNFTTFFKNNKLLIPNCHIYEIFLDNNINHYVNFDQINNIIGDEEWLQGEVDCLCSIASSRIISLSWGVKKKESTHSGALCVCVGDPGSVENHGKHWIHLGHIISIDKNTKQLL